MSEQTNLQTSSSEISAQKAETIQKMFDRISPKYDIGNTILSLGVHSLWKQKFVKRLLKRKALNASTSMSVLDCATGTGDIAFLIENKLAGSDFQIVGVDFSQGMLEEARRRAAENFSRVQFSQADVETLPFESNSFDRASISFGLRNVSDVKKGLREMARVVKPGGRLLILEFGQPQILGFKQIYNLYSSRVLPVLGGMISGDRSAYEYLHKSSSKFLSGKDLCEMADGLGVFSSTTCSALSMGVAYIYDFEVK